VAASRIARAKARAIGRSAPLPSCSARRVAHGTLGRVIRWGERDATPGDLGLREVHAIVRRTRRRARGSARPFSLRRSTSRRARWASGSKGAGARWQSVGKQRRVGRISDLVHGPRWRAIAATEDARPPERMRPSPHHIAHPIAETPQLTRIGGEEQANGCASRARSHPRRRARPDLAPRRRHEASRHHLRHPASSDGRSSPSTRETALAERVNPPRALMNEHARGSGESVGAGNPCPRGDRGCQRSVLLGQGSSSAMGDTAREGSASANRGESCGACRQPGEAPADNSQGTRRGISNRPKRAKRRATPTSREFQTARPRAWTEQAPTPNEDDGSAMRVPGRSLATGDARGEGKCCTSS